MKICIVISHFLKLLKNKIIVESIIIGSNDEYKKLCAVSHITGGYSFHYSNLQEGGVELSSQFINLDERKFKSFTKRNFLEHFTYFGISVIY